MAIDGNVLRKMDKLKKMKLHEAIEQVLIDSNGPLNALEIADRINAIHMYRRRDGRKVPSSQILANAKNYSNHFNIVDGIISLKSNH